MVYALCICAAIFGHIIAPLKRLISWELIAATYGMDISDLKAQLERLHGASFGWALSCCRHDRAMAEDVLQTVYLKILQGKALYRGESKLQTWLFAVIRKTAITERRKSLLRAMTTIPGTDRKRFDLHPETEFEQSETQRRFLLALEKLPARQRETLHLVFYQDLRLREAAKVMGVSIGSARRHYERGKKHLRQLLEGEKVNYEVRWKREENSGAVL